MTRRGLLLTLISVVAADLAGSREQRRGDTRCRRVGRAYERNGLTKRERVVLVEGLHCRKVGDDWLSSDVYQA